MPAVRLMDYCKTNNVKYASLMNRIYRFGLRPDSSGSYESAALDRVLDNFTPRAEYKRARMRDEAMPDFRNYKCPEYNKCLTEAARKREGLSCGGCGKESVSSELWDYIDGK